MWFNRAAYDERSGVERRLEMLFAAIGYWLWVTLAVIVWVAIAFWPAHIAARKRA
jgi:hypothetical protein